MISLIVDLLINSGHADSEPANSGHTDSGSADNAKGLLIVGLLTMAC